MDEYLSSQIAKRWCIHPMCLFVWVSLYVCLSRCLFGRFDYKLLVPRIKVLQEYRWGCLILQVFVTHAWHHGWRHQVKNNSNLKIATTRSVFIIQRGYNYCHNLSLMGPLSNTLHFFYFGFGLKDHQRSKIKAVFQKFQNPCFAHDSFN